MFKPMLAPSESPLKVPDFFKLLQYPLMVSPKLDGIRGITKNGIMKSRKFIDIPSLQAQTEFTLVDHFDGELLEGNWTDHNVYNRSQSHVMSDDKPGDLSYHVFDYVHDDWLNKPFFQRLEELDRVFKQQPLPNYYIVPQRECENEEELLAAEEEFLLEGYEGAIAKSPVGAYKCGRGTFLQGLIYKIKREVDDEGIIVGFVERVINNNQQTRDELGNAKRSHHKANKELAGNLGKFLVEFNGEQINVAPGKFDHEQLQEILYNQEKYLGKYLKFRHFPHGAKDKPRQARALGFRSLMDM
jgi:DNA ligase-1